MADIFDTAAPTIDPVTSAEAADLRYVSDSDPGIRRQRRGRGFGYLAPDSSRVGGKATRNRIRALAIPPAYSDVWICTHANGHLQATGRDERGRKQYLYHSRWREVRDHHKFNHLILFAEALPKIRAQVERDMRKRGLPRDKVVATVVRLLEASLIRVGNSRYARENTSYGLTTLRKKHVEVGNERVHFEFRAKGGQDWQVVITDRRVARVLRRCEELPGYELFKYLDEAGERHVIDSADVNDYLHNLTGAAITAKDFRTWSGTLESAVALADEDFVSEREAKQNVTRTITAVAKHLGNTPSICRKCYVHPAVIDSYLEGTLADMLSDQDGPQGLTPDEAAVLALLKRQLQRTTTLPADE